MSKICSRCKKEKSLEDFGIDNSRKDGRSYFCIECWNIKGRKNVQKFKTKRVLQNKNWSNSESGQIKMKESRQRCRARKKLTDPAYFLIEIVRGRNRNVLDQKNIRKTSRTYEYLGCDIQTLRVWIESQFQKDMDWENRGGDNGWQLDHIVPCSYFDLTDLEQQKICFNYRNLRPLPKRENILKSDLS